MPLFATPTTFLSDPAALETAKRQAASGDPALRPALEKLRREAEAALPTGPWSVMDKPMDPPSGDKHDYYSTGTYWWPDPALPDGRPYMRRDGEVNPETLVADKPRQESMAHTVRTLALAGYLLGEDRYAARAAELVRVWFLDEATRMNPHLRFAQAIPGRHDGWFWGVVDASVVYPQFIEGLGALRATPAWTEELEAGMRAWCGTFLDWLLASEFGRQELAAMNNHGTRMGVMCCSLALFVDRPVVAREIVSSLPQKHIAEGIEPDGRQPEELIRTRAMIYSHANIQAIIELATLAERFGIDVWGYTSPDGRSIRAALDWLTPYGTGQVPFPYQEITPPGPAFMFGQLRRAARAYGEARYERLIDAMPQELIAESRTTLLYPRSAPLTPNP